MTPANSLIDVRRLAGDEANCIFFGAVLEELGLHEMDTDDLRAIVQSELGEKHCFRTRETAKYFPATVSDYYTIWVDVCGSHMFLKLLVAIVNGTERLVITSFKKDNRHDG